MIQVNNLSLNYGRAKILDKLSFEIPKGCMMGLIGPNGAGKSSLIKVLAGLVHPSEGCVQLNKKPLKFADLRLSTGYTVDSPSFYPQLSALENLRLLTRINGVSLNLFELLELVGLKGAETKKVKAFSTGMKQRLAIASSLISAPDLLILDEPFNGLDPGGYRDLWALLNNLNDKGTTLVISSHLLADLEEYATHFMLINKGKIAMTVSKAELTTSKRIVSFYFDQELTTKDLSLFRTIEVRAARNNFTQVLMPSKDIANFIKQLVEAGIPPVNIKTQTILQHSYFEISR